jgi:hypothetical protein
LTENFGGSALEVVPEPPITAMLLPMVVALTALMTAA